MIRLRLIFSNIYKTLSFVATGVCRVVVLILRIIFRNFKRKLVFATLFASISVNAYFLYSVTISKFYQAGLAAGRNAGLDAVFSQARNGEVNLTNDKGESITLILKEAQK